MGSPVNSSEQVPHIYDIPDPRTELLDFGVYRDTLCRLIHQYLGRATEKDRPEDWEGPGGHAFVIGIHGPWGCGKSTLMSMIREKLKPKKEKQEGQVPGLLVVDFHAWKYNEREELWRALLSRVVARAREALDDEDETRALSEEDRNQAAQLCEVIRNTLYRDYEYSKAGPLSLNLSALPPLLLKLGVSWFKPSIDFESIGKGFLKIFQRERIEEFHQRLADLDQFQDNFRKLREALDRPWLILIDDLDRCLPESAIEIFEATKVFLDAAGVVFVLALDKETIRKGLRVRYREKEGEKPLVDPDLYIEKVTNVSFVIPTLSSKSRVEELILGITDADTTIRVDGRGSRDLETLLEKLLDDQERHLQPNPRRWIRLLNTALLYQQMRKGLPPEQREAGDESVFLKLLCLSYRWGGFMEAALNSWEVMETFEQAASQAERNFEKFKEICSQRYPALKMYAEDADLFQLLLSQPPLTYPARPPDSVMTLF